ncbi:MAG: hypothetical protein M9924_21895 [Rhizobiaceae bacterium]|nr:hypothetical protein [Rhizobiaceae bacterium]
MADSEDPAAPGDEGKGYTIQAKGVNEDVLQLATAWLNASEGDALRALVNLAARTVQIGSVMSSGMARGALSVWPDESEAK